MRRHAIGVIALVLLTFAAVLSLQPALSPVGAEFNAAFLRIGILMGVVWISYHQLKRVPVWLFYTFPICVLVLALRPRWFIFVIPVILAVAILKPRPKPQRHARKSTPSSGRGPG